MSWAKSFLLFYFFAQILTGGLSQSTVPADIPGNVRFTIPTASTTLQTSTVTSSIITSSNTHPDQTTAGISQATDTATVTSPPLNDGSSPEPRPITTGAIAGIVVGIVIFLFGVSIAAVWYSRSSDRKTFAIKKNEIEDLSHEMLASKEDTLKERIPVQETQMVEQVPTYTPPTANPEVSSQESLRRLRSTAAGL
ncbi:hypothetical protein TWF718_003745 [Orbilia javanica]|uniref:Mid2 domain-containing protein n=1 Tax=Orbilia javanica TaxID=47235 RepID=A0AAN8N3W5_9PEZI